MEGDGGRKIRAWVDSSNWEMKAPRTALHYSYIEINIFQKK